MVSVKETVAPRGLPHFDRFRSATVGAYLAQGLPLGTAIDQIRVIAEDVLPAGEGYRYTFAGESEDYFESGNALAFAYVLAVW
jgi:multidrug efflux pump